MKGGFTYRFFGYFPGWRQAYRMPAPAIRTAAPAAASPPVVGPTLEALYAKAATSASNASPSVAEAILTGSRENRDMPAVSQALLDFANYHKAPRAPGFEIVETPRYRVVLQPDFPIPGPNGVTYVRCRPDEAEEVIDEVHALVTPRHIPIMWTLDPETEPANFPDYLAARGIHPDPHGPTVEVMALPIDADVEAPEVEGLELKDALADAETFTRSDAVNAEAFASRMLDYSAEAAAQRERRRHNQLAAANRRVILATIDGEPAGAAGISLFPPAGAIINGGAVRSKFRGRGVYRTMVAARLRMAREAGVTGGLAVWGGDMSAPILARLGFETVGSRGFYLDTSTA